jgi:LmbE family N-acetylglucosaminyl deacetylase
VIEGSDKGSEPLRVLVVLAHPDDPDFFCGGTAAKWCAQGHEVIYCLLTRGDKGSDDVDVNAAEMAEQRVAEQRAAAEVTGVREVIFLDYPDGYLMPDLLMRRDITRIIRRTRPEIVITCDPTNFFPSDDYINHADHRAAGEVALDAVFPAARSGMYFPELYQEEGLEPHRVSQVYLAGTRYPNTTIDVTDYFDIKLSALKEHRSQVKDLDELADRLRKRMLDPNSPPDSPRYIETFKRIRLR